MPTDACDNSLDAHDLALREKVERLERERDSAKADLRLACQDVEALRLERDESQDEAWANWNSFTRSQTEVERLTKERDEALVKLNWAYFLFPQAERQVDIWIKSRTPSNNDTLAV